MSHMSSYLSQNPLAQSDLRKLITLCKSSQGPFSHLKVISSEDEIQVTTQSLKILNEFETSDPLLQFAISVVKNYVTRNNDGGLKLTLYIANWLKQSFNSPNYSDIFDWIGSYIFKHLNSEKCVLKIELERNNIKNFIIFTENLIKSKPASSLNDFQVKQISILVVRALYNSIPSETAENSLILGRVNFLSIAGADPSESKLFESAIIPISNYFFDSEIFKNFISSKLNTGYFKVCLISEAFDESLVEKFNLEYANCTDPTEIENESLVSELSAILESENINILACQKGLNSSIRLNLERRNILVLERLGAESLQIFKNVSVAQNNHKHGNWPISIGELKSIEILEISNQKYFTLQGSEKTKFQTILIQNLSKETTEEAKAVVQKAYEVLKTMLLRKNNLVPGVGCAESILVNYLKKEVKTSSKIITDSLKCKEHEVIEVVDSFCSGLLQTVVPLGINLSDLMTDRHYGHLFIRDSDKCQCGMIEKKDNLELHQINTPLIYWDDLNMRRKPNPEIYSNRDVVFDNYEQFISTLSIAIETASLMLRTSLCVYEKE